MGQQINIYYNVTSEKLFALKCETTLEDTLQNRFKPLSSLWF